MRHSLVRADHGLPPDQLTARLLAECALGRPQELIRHFHGGTTRGHWAEKSRLVFAAAGHRPSQDMIRASAAALAEQARAVAEQISLTGPVILGGGLGLNQPALQQALAAELETRGLTGFRPIPTEPVCGILHPATAASRDGHAGGSRLGPLDRRRR